MVRMTLWNYTSLTDSAHARDLPIHESVPFHSQAECARERPSGLGGGVCAYVDARKAESWKWR
jgi:hypothetical protein